MRVEIQDLLGTVGQDAWRYLTRRRCHVSPFSQPRFDGGRGQPARIRIAAEIRVPRPARPAQRIAEPELGGNGLDDSVMQRSLFAAPSIPASPPILGLEQDFNSLDNQREVSGGYIKSQAHEGWRLVRERFDDGGFSGGSMERPALQKLLADVKARKIDVIVVYKVDRLTLLRRRRPLSEGRDFDDFGEISPPEHLRGQFGQRPGPMRRDDFPSPIAPGNDRKGESPPT